MAASHIAPEDFSGLASALQDAWNAQYHLESLRRTIRNHESLLVNPVEPGPSEADRKEIQGKKIRLKGVREIHIPNDHVIKLILDMSDAHGINEKMALRFILAGRQQINQRLGTVTLQTMQDAARELYMARRTNLLTALLDIVHLSAQVEPPTELSMTVSEFVRQLIRDNLVVNLIAFIKNLLSFEAWQPADQAARDTQVWYAVQILFFVSRAHAIPDKQVIQLLDLLRFSSGVLLKRGDPDGTINLCCYMLLTTLLEGLNQLGSSDEFTMGTDKSARRLQEFIKEFDSTFSASQWENEEFRLHSMLVWTVFLQRASLLVDDLIDLDDVSRRSLEALGLSNSSGSQQAANVQLFVLLERNFLRSKRFLSESADNQLALCEVLAEFLLAVVVYNYPEKIRRLNDVQYHQWARVDRQQDASPAVYNKYNFSALLSCLALICKFSPSSTSLFWCQSFDQLTDNTFPDFLRYADSEVSFQSPLLEPYVELLEALCSTDEGANQVYQLLDRSRSMNFRQVFHHFGGLVHEYSAVHNLDDRAGQQFGFGDFNNRPQRRQPKPLSRAQVQEKVLTLRLLQAVVRAPTIQRTLFGDHKLRPLETLFDLLGCTFVQSLKGEIIRTITAFVRDHPDAAREVWERLEQTQILPTATFRRLAQIGQVAVANGGAQQARHALGPHSVTSLTTEAKSQGSLELRGVVYDLEQVEKAHRTYPITVAFTELVLELLYAVHDEWSLATSPGPMPSCPLDFQPYLTFVTDHVFASLDHRSYNKQLERWKLTEIALGIFCQVIEDFNPEDMETRVPDPVRDASANGGQGYRYELQSPNPALLLMQALCSPHPLFAKLMDVISNTQKYLLSRLQEQEKKAQTTAQQRVSSSGRQRALVAVGHLNSHPSHNERRGQHSHQVVSKFNTQVEVVNDLREGQEAEGNAVQASLMLALKLLASVLQKEDTFLQVLRSHVPHTHARAPSSMLLKHPEQVLSIARSVGVNRTLAFLTPVAGSLPSSVTGKGRVRGHDTALAFEGQLSFYAAQVVLALSRHDQSLLVQTFEVAKQSMDIIQGFADHFSALYVDTPTVDAAPTSAPFPNDMVDTHVQLDDTGYSEFKTMTPYSGGARADLSHADLEPSLTSAAPQAPANNTQSAAEKELSNWFSRCRLTILQILVENLRAPAPNLTHLLLGFDITKPDNTQLRDSATRACLDALLSVAAKPRVCAHTPALAEGCFELFYRLCADPITSAPFLTYLQLPAAHEDERESLFFHALEYHLQCAPSADAMLEDGPRYLLQRAWLMKALGVQLHLTARRVENDSEFVTYALSYLGLAPESADNSSSSINATFPAMSTPAWASSSALGQRSAGDFGRSVPKSLKILELLAVLDQVDVDDAPQMPSTINELHTEQFRQYVPPSYQYDVKALLLAVLEVKPKDAELIAQTALTLNKCNEVLRACVELFTGWRSMMEVCLQELFSLASREQHDAEACETILYHLLVGILRKLAPTPNVPSSRVWTILGQSAAGASLLVMTKLREQVGSTNGQLALQSHTILELTVQSALANEYYTARAHLYGVFFNYIQYVRELRATSFASPHFFFADEYEMTSDALDNIAFRSLGTNAMRDLGEEQRTVVARNVEFLLSIGPRLLEIVCNDVSDSDARLRPLAGVLINTLLSLSLQMHKFTVTWLERELIQVLLSEIARQASGLRNAVASSSLRGHHLILNYHSITSILINVARSAFGAKVLMEARVIQTLAKAGFLAQQPELLSISNSKLGADRSGMDDVKMAQDIRGGLAAQSDPPDPFMSIMPSAASRYLLLLIPALRLLVGMLTSTPQNQRLHQEALSFVYDHHDMLMALLRDTQVHIVSHLATALSSSSTAGNVSMLSLRAVKLITALYYLLYTGPLHNSHFQRFHDGKELALLLQVLAGFARPDIQAVRRRLAPADDDVDMGAVEPDIADPSFGHISPHTVGEETAWECVDETCRNILALCSVSVIRAPDVPLFGCTIGDEHKSAHEQGLDPLINVLDRMSQKALDALSNEKACRSALESLHTQTFSSFDFDLGGLSRFKLDLPETVNISFMRAVAFRKLVALRSSLLKDIGLAVFCLENALQVLFHHIHGRMQRKAPSFQQHRPAQLSRIVSPNSTPYRAREQDNDFDVANLQRQCTDILNPILSRLEQIVIAGGPSDPSQTEKKTDDVASGWPSNSSGGAGGGGPASLGDEWATLSSTSILFLRAMVLQYRRLL